MVHIALLASSLGALAATVVSAATGVCTKAPYVYILPLSNYPPAESFCSSKYPVKPCTTTSTAISTSHVTTTVATIPVTIGTSTATTTVATSSVTLTTSTATDTTTTDTTTITVTTGVSTVTTYDATTTVCSAGPTKRDVLDYAPLDVRDVATIPLRPDATSTAVKKRGRYEAREPAVARAKTTTTTKGNPTASLYSSFASQAASFVSTACSCIEAPKPCVTSTTTSVVTSTSSATYITSVVATVTTSVTLTVTSFTDTTTTTSVQATTTTSVEGTTTTDAGTSTVLTACIPDCTNTVYSSNGICFNNNCQESASFSGYTSSSTTTVGSLQACVDACAKDSACNGYNYDSPSGTCSLFDNASTPGNVQQNFEDAYGTYTGASC